MVDDCCKDVATLQKLGSFGNDFFDTKRTILMGASVFLTVLSGILTIVAMAGSSVDNDTVRNCAWTTQENEDYTIYYGTTRFVWDQTTTTRINQNYEDCSSDFCNDCEDAGQTATNCSVFTFIFILVLIVLTVLRMFPSWDKIMYKTSFIVFSAVNMLVMIIGMGSWDDVCADAHITEGEVHLGPGLNSYVAAFFFLLFVTVIHLFTPVNIENATTEALTGGDDDNYKPYEEAFVNEK